MLTERARQYLGTLERVTPVPAARVEQALREQGERCFPAWLEFQDRYAGYVQPLGFECAVFGIVHAQSWWIKPGWAAVSRSYESGADWFVTCAESHPSFVYELGDTGLFKAPTASTFEIKLERDAVHVAFFARPGARRLYPAPSDAADVARLAGKAALVVEASDEHYQAWVGDRFYGLQEASSGQWVELATCG